MRKKRVKVRPADPGKLYAAARLMDRGDREALSLNVPTPVYVPEPSAARDGSEPEFRLARLDLGLSIPVTIYVQDPMVAKGNPKLGLKQIHLDWEPDIKPGPTSARIAVVDYNADTGVLKDPVRWDQRTWRFMGADDPASFQFHQVNVWAIIQNILAFFEAPPVMGRAIPWAFEGNRLIVVPHAGYCQNAFYDRHSKSLQFYYCGAEEAPVYTCLSHDIVAHETGHAVLDGIRPYYNRVSSVQTAAFHEFLADLTAILSALRNNDVRQVVADLSQGDLTKEAVIADLAEEFGQELAGEAPSSAARPYLRSANNAMKMRDIRGEWRPHRCSQVLTGAVFEILSQIALKHLEDGESPRTALWHATDRLTRIALRALDYCPPVDIQFADYAQAMLRADELAYPLDTLGYRKIIRKVFRGRGMRDLDAEPPPYNVRFRRYDIGRLSRSRTAAYHFLHENRALLGVPVHQDVVVADLHDTDKAGLAGRTLPREIILEYVWGEDVELDHPRFGPLQGQTVQLVCGGTLVFDGRGNVLHWAFKPGTEESRYREDGDRRREWLRKYVAVLVDAGVVGLTDEGGVEGLDVWVPPVAAQRVNGRLRLEVTPHLRHVGDEWGGVP